MNRFSPSILLIFAIGAFCTRFAGAQIAQWDFDGTLAPTVGGKDLAIESAAPAGAPQAAFQTLQIVGAPAGVASFSRGTYFRASHELSPNGGGNFVNQYTIILDVMFPSRPSGWAVLWQTSQDNANDGEWFINPSRGVGISGNYGGIVADGTWNRLALAVDLASGSYTSFVNGVQRQQNTGLELDGRFSLEPTGLLFADDNQENSAGYVNSVQVRDYAMSPAEILSLGGPTAGGIPVPPPPTLRVGSPNGGERLAAGANAEITWISEHPQGYVAIELFKGGALQSGIGEAPMTAGRFAWSILPFIGNGADYQVKVSWAADPSTADASDAPFEISGSLPPPNPQFGRPLELNGGFEDQLASWEVIAGKPLTLKSGAGKRDPRSGERFFHGGLDHPGSCVVRQEVDLLAAGFTAGDIDGGSALDAAAYLRNWLGAGTFDDQIYCRVTYLDAETNPISSLRCIIAGDDSWLYRRLNGLVPAGTRRLRAEIIGQHRRDRDNDSMADDLSIKLQVAFPLVQPSITKLPMLQDARQDAMALLWETDGNMVNHAVEWGRTSAGEHVNAAIDTLQIDGSHFVHRAVIQPLEAQTEYVYRVRSGTAASPVFGFRTAPLRETPFSVAWTADNQNGPSILRQHVPRIAQRQPDLVAFAGDVVQNGNNISEWHTQWFTPLEVASLAQTRPVLFNRGNHDGEHALAYAYSILPGNESWFAFDFGNSRFIFLDSEVDSAGSPEQLAWFRAELERPETRAAQFRIASFHRPPFTNLWDSPEYNGEAFVRNSWVRLFETAKVDLVICGHAHAYERGDLNGVHYLIVGGGGGALDTVRSGAWSLFDLTASKHHYAILKVAGNLLSWTAYDLADKVLDSFEIASRTPDPGALLPFHRGDPNGDGATDIADGIYLFLHLFVAPGSIPCRESADANNDGNIDIGDAIGILRYLFLRDQAPAAPGAAPLPCGFDPDAPGSERDSGCQDYTRC